MKIAILSCNAHTKVLNFASPLHSYVFQQWLLENGYESTIIDYKPVYTGRFDIRHPLFFYIDNPDKNQSKQQRLLEKWKTLFYERESRYDRFENFIIENYETTETCYDPWLLDEEDPGFDVYMVVTDIVWKRNPKTGFDKGFMLASKCMEGKKKMAVSVSRGANGYKPGDDIDFFRYLSDMDAVSVREESLQTYINDHTDLDIQRTVDPVFLMGPEFYEGIAHQPSVIHPQGFVLVYLAMENNPDLIKMASDYAAAKGLPLIELSEVPTNENYPEGTHHEVLYDLGVEEWVWYLMHSDYTFTNSFHACCFSMIFHRQFFAGYRTGDKVGNLLGMFDIAERQILTNNAEDALALSDIDFDAVQEKIDTYSAQLSKYVLDNLRRFEEEQHKPCMTQEDLDKTYKMLDEEHREINEARALEAAEKRAHMEELERQKEEARAKRLKEENSIRRRIFRFGSRAVRKVFRIK